MSPAHDNTVSDLSGVLNEVGQLVVGIADTQWSAPTPCDEWDVRAVVDHLLDMQQRFHLNLTGNALPADASYVENAAALTSAFGEDGALERIVDDRLGPIPGQVLMNILIMENLAHGWDLGQACGHVPVFDDSVAERTIGFVHIMQPKVPPHLRRFKDPQPVPDDAPAIDRLVALLGRTAMV